jgi:perosamine synthetase
VFEQYPILGFNYRLTDIQAAIGREQVKRLTAMVARRRELAAVYHDRLSGLPGVALPFEPAAARSNWQTYMIQVAAPLEQRVVMQRMLDDGVSTRRGAMNAHREPSYPPGSWHGGPLPRSEQLQDTGIALPLFHQMTAGDQDRVIESLRRAVAP